MQLYPFQNLGWGERKVASMLLADHTIMGVFIFMRKQSRWSAIGDFPMLCFICGMANLLHVPPSRMELMYILKNSKEESLREKWKDEKIINQLLTS